eukprot:m.58846 g.58846  ORF g.58846 m.58846 type:complete len:534 (+) comp34837_c0_seq3:83-1684(+)
MAAWKVIWVFVFGLWFANGGELKVEVVHKPAVCKQLSRNGDYLSYHYVGKLLDGAEFDSSFNYKQPYRFTLGRRMVIQGMEQGMAGMCVGERRKITIPPEMAYGEAGSGSKIPPNSVLVFYVDLLTIERSGHSLSPSETSDDVFQSALNAYTSEHWDESVVLFEAALIAKEKEDAFLRKCYVERCSVDAVQVVNLQGDASNGDFLFKQMWAIVQRKECRTKCREELFGRHKQLDMKILEKWRSKEIYNYLQFSYHNLNRTDEAREACQTYFEFHPSDKMTISNLRYYYSLLPKGQAQRPYAPRVWFMEHKRLYHEGQLAYRADNWTIAVEKMEAALVNFYDTLNDCYLDCLTNFTEFFDWDLENEAGDDVLSVAARYVSGYLSCQIHCLLELTDYNETANVKEDYYIGSHYHHLQFAYYKLGDIKSASQCTAAYQLFNPEDETTKANIAFYIKELETNLIPREDAVKFKLQEAKLMLLFEKVEIPRSFVVPEVEKIKGDLGKDLPKGKSAEEEETDSDKGIPVVHKISEEKDS